MICVALNAMSPEACLDLVTGPKALECAEIRMDSIELDVDFVRKLFSSSKAKLVATCREGLNRGLEARAALMVAACESGASWADVEMDAPEEYLRAIRNATRKSGTKLIVSFHDYIGTPDISTLKTIVDSCYALGGDIAKLACLANNKADAARMLSLYDSEKPIISLAMGSFGAITRVASLFLGAPFSYASIGSGKESASGQLDIKRMKLALSEIGDEGR